jgi:hypothetical protein
MGSEEVSEYVSFEKKDGFYTIHASVRIDAFWSFEMDDIVKKLNGAVTNPKDKDKQELPVTETAEA